MEKIDVLMLAISFVAIFTFLNIIAICVIFKQLSNVLSIIGNIIDTFNKNVTKQYNLNKTVADKINKIIMDNSPTGGVKQSN